MDSAVAAALVQRAIGDRLTCVFVDHGLLRQGEREQVEKDFVAATGAKLVTAHEKDAFLKKLAGVTEPEAKRKAIGAEFIRSFERAVTEVLESARKVPRWITLCREPCIQTLSNPVAAAELPTSRATTMSVACQMTWNSSWLSLCACCLRMKFARW